MSEVVTATAPGGVVHELDGNQTLCGQDASSWSRAVSSLQQMGLVIFCADCEAAAQKPAVRAHRATPNIVRIAIAVFAAAGIALGALGAAGPDMYHHGPPGASGAAPSMYHHG